MIFDQPFLSETFCLLSYLAKEKISYLRVSSVFQFIEAFSKLFFENVHEIDSKFTVFRKHEMNIIIQIVFLLTKRSSPKE